MGSLSRYSCYSDCSSGPCTSARRLRTDRGGGPPVAKGQGCWQRPIQGDGRAPHTGGCHGEFHLVHQEGRAKVSFLRLCRPLLGLPRRHRPALLLRMRGSLQEGFPSKKVDINLQFYVPPIFFYLQLYLHLRLHHRSERASELRRAFSAAEEEVALTRRSGSVYRCALCHRQFTDNGAFSAHVQTKHSMQWREYKERYGRCEIESAPFQCQVPANLLLLFSREC